MQTLQLFNKGCKHPLDFALPCGSWYQSFGQQRMAVYDILAICYAYSYLAKGRKTLVFR